MSPPASDKDQTMSDANKENAPTKDQNVDATLKSKTADTKKPKTEDELSEEDKQLKEQLDLLVTVITEEYDASKHKSHANAEAVRRAALDSMTSAIKSSTSSMTSIPKPLKYLKPHLPTLETHFASLPDKDVNKSQLASVLSVLCMTKSSALRQSLKYKLLADKLSPTGQPVEIGLWGHEYVRNLSGEVGFEFTCRETPLAQTVGADQKDAAADAAAASRTGDKAKFDPIKTPLDTEYKTAPYKDLDALISAILPFFMSHNAETDAIDLLIEVESLHLIQNYLTRNANAEKTAAAAASTSHGSADYERVCRYIIKCSEYLVDEDESRNYLTIVYQVYVSHRDFVSAMRCALRLYDRPMMIQLMKQCETDSSPDAPLILKQLAYLLAEQRIALTEDEYEPKDDQVKEIAGNCLLHDHFLQLVAKLDTSAPKTPEDIYKSHLEEGASGSNVRRAMAQQRAQATGSAGLDSAKQYLASSFVNAMVNAAYGTDTLLTPTDSEWLYKNKSHGQVSATASIGLINLWDCESGFSSIDRYSFSASAEIKHGAILANGILSTGVHSDMDAAFALLSEHVESTTADAEARIAAIFGLGLAYLGTQRSDVLELLIPILVDPKNSMELVSHACLSLGLVFCGSASDDISGSIIEAFMDRSKTELRDSSARLMCIGLGLLFLSTGSNVSTCLEALAVVDHPIKPYLKLTVQTCAYVGKSSPLQIQEYLQVLLEHHKDEAEEEAASQSEAAQAKAKEAASLKPVEKTPEEIEAEALALPFKGMHQEAAVLGIALVSMGEELSTDMSLRALDHVLQYGEVNVRRIVPLALGLLSVSNPRLPVMDTLSKLTHDSDEQVSQHSILALGLLCAGTNNSRCATILRQLASYYAKEANHLFLVRIAQGLLHLGKGLLTASPLQSDGFLLSRSAMCGLITLMHVSCDLSSSILGKRHYLLYSIVATLRPRMLMTVDSDLQPVAVDVRLGQAVDTVGMAGKPKSITGFQTHATPVLLSAGERCEIANPEEWQAMSPILEGIVIVKKRPEYKPNV